MEDSKKIPKFRFYICSHWGVSRFYFLPRYDDMSSVIKEVLPAFTPNE